MKKKRAYVAPALAAAALWLPVFAAAQQPPFGGRTALVVPPEGKLPPRSWAAKRKGFPPPRLFRRALQDNPHDEVLILERINVARADLDAESERLKAKYGPQIPALAAEGLKEGLGGLPGATTTYWTNKPPLALNQAREDGYIGLALAAKAHSADMWTRDYFSHNTLGSGATPQQRVEAQGYYHWTGESIAGGTNLSAEAACELWLLDWYWDGSQWQPIGGRGHRVQILGLQPWALGVKEIGLGSYHGATGSSGNQNLGFRDFYTADFGTQSGTNDVWLLGVVYDDQNANGLYEIGEGLGGVAVEVREAGVMLQATTTAVTGYYQLKVTPGASPRTCEVVAAGGELGGVVRKQATILAGADAVNVRLTMEAAEAASASLTLSSPNGGESYLGGQNLTIQWTSSGVAGKVRIEFFDGNSWSEVVAATENDGSYTWLAPAIDSTGCKVRVSALSGDPADESDSAFAVSSPADSDGDGMADAWEIRCFGDLFPDGSGDGDGDGLNDLGEFQYQTDPANPDSDGDGPNDGEEVSIYGTNPASPDSDGDGMPDGWEAAYVTRLDPTVADGAADGDGDGFSNAAEYAAGTDPTDPASRPKSGSRSDGRKGGLGCALAGGISFSLFSPVLLLLALRAATSGARSLIFGNLDNGNRAKSAKST